MSCFSGIYDKVATVYTIDKSETTQSGQPIESLVQRTTTACIFANHIKNVWALFQPGQIKIGDFVLMSAKSITDGEVVEIDGEKYLVEAANPIKIPGKNHIFGYKSYLTRYKH